MIKQFQTRVILKNLDSGARSYRISIPNEKIDNWIVHLMMLNFRMIEALQITDFKQNQTFILKVAKDPDKRYCHRVYGDSQKPVVSIPRGELESWIEFYISYKLEKDKWDYRYHIDCQISQIDPSLSFAELFVVLNISKSISPTDNSESHQ